MVGSQIAFARNWIFLDRLLHCGVIRVYNYQKSAYSGFCLTLLLNFILCFSRAFSPEVTISDDMTGQFSFIQMNKSDDHLAQNFRRVSNTDQGVNNSRLCVSSLISVHKGLTTEHAQKQFLNIAIM